MGRKRYTAEEKAAALAALWASASERDGEWVPNFHSASKAQGVPRPTLHRWWDQRDRTADGQFRTVRAQEVNKAEHQGARDWFRSASQKLRGKVDALIESDWTELEADRQAQAAFRTGKTLELLSAFGDRAPEQDQGAPERVGRAREAWARTQGEESG